MALLPGVIRWHVGTRPKTAERGYDSKWQRYSIQYLKDNPICADPYKRHLYVPVRSEVTDHVIAHKLFQSINSGDPDRIQQAQQLFWSSSNHQALCADCNRIKNIKEEGGFAKQR